MLTRSRHTDERSAPVRKHRVTSSDARPNYPPYSDWSVETPTSIIGEERWIDDEPHHDFIRRKRQGEIMIGDLSIRKTLRTQSDGSMSGFVPDWNETWTRTGDLICEAEFAASNLEPNIGSRFLPSMTDVALVKAYAKMKQSDVMGMEVLSELDKTVGMLHRPFSKAASHLNKMSMRKRDLLKSGRNLAQAISSSWLEYRYGWQPIILDANQIIKSVHEKHHIATRARRLVARASVNDEWSTNHPFTNATMTPGFYWTRSFTGTLNVVDTLGVHAGVIYDVASRTTTEQLDKMLGGRYTDTIPFVWEKIPYSFVVDWFVNVGDWLQAITPDPFTTVVGSWVTSKHKVCLTVNSNVTCHPTAGSTLTGSAGSSFRSTETVTRTANPVCPPLPSLTNRSLSRLHQADAGALLIRPVIDGLRSFSKSR